MLSSVTLPDFKGKILFQIGLFFLSLHAEWNNVLPSTLLSLVVKVTGFFVPLMCTSNWSLLW